MSKTHPAADPVGEVIECLRPDSRTPPARSKARETVTLASSSSASASARRVVAAGWLRCFPYGAGGPAPG